MSIETHADRGRITWLLRPAHPVQDATFLAGAVLALAGLATAFVSAGTKGVSVTCERVGTVACAVEQRELLGSGDLAWTAADVVRAEVEASGGIAFVTPQGRVPAPLWSGVGDADRALAEGVDAFVAGGAASVKFEQTRWNPVALVGGLLGLLGLVALGALLKTLVHLALPPFVQLDTRFGALLVRTRSGALTRRRSRLFVESIECLRGRSGLMHVAVKFLSGSSLVIRNELGLSDAEVRAFADQLGAGARPVGVEVSAR